MVHELILLDGPSSGFGTGLDEIPLRTAPAPRYPSRVARIDREPRAEDSRQRSK
ncbi:hypothetical protein [Nannocystis pusilla]|uniref:hypothetical protein n=1 Tax=Nannocystis pusilla TaxID=889268 RepID=UPI003B799E74